MRIEEERLESVLDAVSDVHLLVIGDVVLDEYLWGEVERISPEAPVPVVHVNRESTVLGGAGNVVRNIVALGGSCSFCSIVGDDPDGDRVRELIAELGVDSRGVVSARGKRTIRKTRVVARSQQVVRFDRESLDEISKEASAQILRFVEEEVARASGAILEDYGKGLFTPGLVAELMSRFSVASVPVAVDPKGEVAHFKGASLVKPNLAEAERLTGIRVRDRAELEQVAVRLREQLGGGSLVITRGGEGLTIFDGDRPGVDVCTVRRGVFDVQGAGDTTIAALVLALRAGATLLEAAVIANAAAGVVVGKVGTATASRQEVRELLPAAIAAAQGGR